LKILPGTMKILPRHCDVGRRGTSDVHTRVLAPLARHVSEYQLSMIYQLHVSKSYRVDMFTFLLQIAEVPAT